jgi:preprotein translocase subunit SecD
MLQIDTWKRVLIWLVCVTGLLLALPNAFYTRVEQSNDAKAAIELGADTPENQAEAAQWPNWLPSSLVNLGLDLRGGAHLLAEVKVEDVYESRMEAMWPEIRDALRDERSTVGTIRRQDSDPDQIRVRISQPEGMSRALETVRGLARQVQTLTGVGATDIEAFADGDTIVVQLSEAEKLASDDRTVRQSLEIVRRRIDEVGTREPTIQRQGADRILIQVPGIGSAGELKEIIGTRRS